MGTPSGFVSRRPHQLFWQGKLPFSYKMEQWSRRRDRWTAVFTLLKLKGTVGWKVLLDNALCMLTGTRAGPERPWRSQWRRIQCSLWKIKHEDVLRATLWIRMAVLGATHYQIKARLMNKLCLLWTLATKYIINVITVKQLRKKNDWRGIRHNSRSVILN